MFRTSLSFLFCAALAMALVSGCGSPTTAPTASNTKGNDNVEALVFEVDEIEIAPEASKDVKVKTGKAESAEPSKEAKDAGVSAKVADGKVTVSASKEAKEGTYDVHVKGGKKDAAIKVKVKKAEK
jgi:nitrogen fixation protein FixH